MPRRRCGACGRGLRKCSQTRDGSPSREIPSIVHASRAGGKIHVLDDAGPLERARRAPPPARSAAVSPPPACCPAAPRPRPPTRVRSATATRTATGARGAAARAGVRHGPPRSAAIARHSASRSGRNSTCPGTGRRQSDTARALAARRGCRIVHGIDGLGVRPDGHGADGMLLERPEAPVRRRHQVVGRDGVDNACRRQGRRPATLMRRGPGSRCSRHARPPGSIPHVADPAGAPAGQWCRPAGSRCGARPAAPAARCHSRPSPGVGWTSDSTRSSCRSSSRTC